MDDKIDALDLLHEYIYVYPYIIFANGKYKSLSWDNQIRVQRINTLLHAYLDIAIDEHINKDKRPKIKLWDSEDDKMLQHIVDFFNFDLNSIPEISDTDLESVLAKIKSVQHNPRVFDKIADQQDLRPTSKFRNTLYRHIMLGMLMKARLKSAELTNVYSGILEGGEAVNLVYTTVRGLYFEPLYESDKAIDEIIVGLMGSAFKRSFSKDELVLNYGYPKETDDELFDYKNRQLLK